LIAVQFRQILWAFLSASPQGVHGGEYAAEAISAHEAAGEHVRGEVMPAPVQ